MKVYKSFAELGNEMGIKSKKIASEPGRKCPECGKPMRHIVGTNTWVCDFATMEDKPVKNSGEKVQVFTHCASFDLAV